MERKVAVRGRGTASNPTGRFERLSVEPEISDGEAPGLPVTQYFRDLSRSVISRNDSPDVPYTVSLNPYRGCEHGCVYCYARPYHEYLGLSAGLDFETKIFVKERAPDLLRTELGRRNWTAEPLAMCGVTDAYQPVERRLQLTRRCLEVLVECRQPVGLITKSSLVSRDVDLLAELARHGAVHVALTVTTLDESLRRISEPRAPTTEARFEAIARLAERGVPVGIMISPVIPGLTDHETPMLLSRARQAGASFAHYTMLRLPHGVADLFEAWLDLHLPGHKTKILGRLRQLRGGCVTDGRFGSRMSGEGTLANLHLQLFDRARERAGLASEFPRLSSAGFRRPSANPRLFD